MSHNKDDIRIDKAEDTSLETKNILVGAGAYNSSCKSSDNGKGVGIMYQQQGAAKINSIIYPFQSQIGKFSKPSTSDDSFHVLLIPFCFFVMIHIF